MNIGGAINPQKHPYKTTRELAEWLCLDVISNIFYGYRKHRSKLALDTPDCNHNMKQILDRIDHINILNRQQKHAFIRNLRPFKLPSYLHLNCVHAKGFQFPPNSNLTMLYPAHSSFFSPRCQILLSAHVFQERSRVLFSVVRFLVFFFLSKSIFENTVAVSASPIGFCWLCSSCASMPKQQYAPLASF